LNSKIPLEVLTNSHIVTTDNLDKTINNFGGATSQSGGTRGFVPAPSSADLNKFLKSDGTWSSTDVVVDQVLSTSDNTYPLLLTPTVDASADQGALGTIFAAGIKANPSTSTIIATTFSGNATSANQFSSNKSVELTGDVSGSASSKAGWSITTTLSNSGVTAGSYGPSENASPAHKGTFSVPYITVDAKGRVTAASTKIITLPSDNDTNNKVTQNVSTTNSTYPLLASATANASENVTTTSIYASGVQLNPAAGEIIATKFTGNLTGDVTGNVSGSSGSCTGNAATATKVNKNLVIKLKSGSTEGTDLYTFNGSAAKTLDIKQGSNITLTAAAGSLTIASTNTTYSATANTGIELSGTAFSGITAAKDVLGVVKTSSTVTSTSGLTACPIIDGIVYYKDTNTTYTFTNKAATLAWGTASTIATVGGTDITVTMPANPNTDTHWTTKLIAGTSDSTANAATTNGNTTLRLFDNSSARSTIAIKGTGATTVTSDANGVITINSTDTNTTYSLSSLGIGNVKNYDQSKAIKAITRNGTTFTYTCLDGTTGTFTQQDNNTTYSAMTGASSSADGATGLVPKPTKGNQNKFLRADGTWQTPTNTTYSNMTAATADAAGTSGLVPAPAAGKQTSFLRGDGTWVVPTNTTYGAASTTTNGLVTTGGQSWAGQKAFTGGVNLYKSNLKITVNKGSADTTDYAVDVLKALGDNAGYGLNLALGGSGNMIVGGGESPNSQLTDLKDNSGEDLYLVADGAIYLKTNGNTWANAKTITLDNTAHLSGLEKVTATSFVGNVTGNVTGNCSGSSGSCTGNAATATKATKDSAGQQINTTYIKALSVNGKVITYTKGDDTTGTITTQDTNTTYSNFVKSGSGAKAGLVPAPSTTAGTTHYLREDGTWQVPPNTTYTFTAGTSALSWNTEVTLATVGGLAIKAKLPANPNTNTDTLVTQNISTADNHYPLLATPTANATANQGAKTAIFDSKVSVNPSVGVIFCSGTCGVNKDNSTENANDLYIKKAGATALYFITTNGGNKLTNVPAAQSMQLESHTVRYLSDTDWVVDQIAHNSGAIRFRSGTNGTWTGWKTFAFTDSSISGTAANVSGTVAIDHGGTGSTTRLGALKNLTNENVGSGAQYFLTITSNWAKGGYTSVADAKTALGLKSAAYTESSAYAAASHTHNYLPLSGGTVTGTLTLTRSTDAAGGKDNKPALIIGGASTAGHIEIDNNEILAKSDGTTSTQLNLNTDGGLVAIGNGGLTVGTGGVTTTGTFIKNNSGITKGTNPSSTAYWTITLCDKNGGNYANNCIGMFETSMSTAGLVSTYMRAVKNEAASSANCTISCIYDTANNIAYTAAPTPADNDNTTKIATTAWVQHYCNTTKKYLTSHQSLSNYLTRLTNVSEMGRYIDFHYDNATAKYDYDVRFQVNSQGTAAGGGVLEIVAASVKASKFEGPLTGNADTATKLHTARYLDGVSFQGDGDRVHYVTCTTAAGTAAKATGTLTGYALKTGGRVLVRFTNTNTAANPTLNVNSTGAKAIYAWGAAIPARYIQANTIYEFIYNGTQYEMVNPQVSAKHASSLPSSTPADLAEGGILIVG